MEFWGVEVKSGEPLKVNPGDGKIVHLSAACLGDVSKDKGSEPVSLYVKFDNQKLVIGILSSEKFPQISYDLVFEKEFELSHNLKSGSVFFTGYKAEPQVEPEDDDDIDDSSDEDIPVIAANGKPGLEAKNGVKLDANEAKQKEKNGDKKKNKANEKDANEEDEEDSSESESGDSDEDSSEDEPMANGKMELEASEDENDSDDDDEDDDDESDDEETPKKTELSNKRVHESSKKTPPPEKKAKLVTPQKTDGKTGGHAHVATPYPSKQALKAAADNRQSAKPQTPKSGGDYSCKPCNRSFKTEDALNSHNKAKHSA